MNTKTALSLLSIIEQPRPHHIHEADIDSVWCNAVNALIIAFPLPERRLLQFGADSLPIQGKTLSHKQRIAELRRRMTSRNIQFNPPLTSRFNAWVRGEDTSDVAFFHLNEIYRSFGAIARAAAKRKTTTRRRDTNGLIGCVKI